MSQGQGLPPYVKPAVLAFKDAELRFLDSLPPGKKRTLGDDNFEVEKWHIRSYGDVAFTIAGLKPCALLAHGAACQGAGGSCTTAPHEARGSAGQGGLRAARDQAPLPHVKPYSPRVPGRLGAGQHTAPAVPAGQGHLPHTAQRADTRGPDRGGAGLPHAQWRRHHKLHRRHRKRGEGRVLRAGGRVLLQQARGHSGGAAPLWRVPRGVGTAWPPAHFGHSGAPYAGSLHRQGAGPSTAGQGVGVLLLVEWW